VPGDYVRIGVCDTGIGMQPDQAESFRFFLLKKLSCIPNAPTHANRAASVLILSTR